MVDEEEREAKRLSYLVSALVHLSVILVVISLRLTNVPTPAPEPTPKVVQRVRLVAPTDLGPLLPRTGPAPTPPPPRPTPPPGRDRISIGAESDQRQRELILQKDVEIGKARTPGAPGTPGTLRPSPGERPVPDPGSSVPPASAEVRDGVEAPRRATNELPMPRSPQGWPAPPAASEPGSTGLRKSLRNLDQRVGSGDAGIEKGSGQRMGPLLFDPRGADFTQWVNQFSREVYRNWLIPQPALLGLRGHVDIEFTVARDGSVSGVRILKPSGVPAFDRAAANALVASRLLPLPQDYRPDSVTMQASFYYNEDPQRS
jgi:protein TonB